jgi:deazaflavin-dependent oxidoreductase (nitroreductase family)
LTLISHDCNPYGRPSARNFEMTTTRRRQINPHRAAAACGKSERALFRRLNEHLMLQMLESGLGRFMGSPPTGYFVLLRTTGRKSGKVRTTPLNYAIHDGCVYCLAGFGESTPWLANLKANPRVQLRLPDRTIEALAEMVADRWEARRMAVRVARNSGFALAIEHPGSLFMRDRILGRVLDGRPVVRLRPLDGRVVPGPYDPGGRGWILPMLAGISAEALLIALVARIRR